MIFGLEKMCKVMPVSIIGCNDCQSRDQDISKIKAVEDLVKKIKASYESSDSTYGSPRITKDLQRQGIQISRPRVAHIYCSNSLKKVTSP